MERTTRLTLRRPPILLIASSIALLWVTTASADYRLVPTGFDLRDWPRFSTQIMILDDQGKRVTDLLPSDVILTENGEPRPIAGVGCPVREQTLPLSSILAIDISGSMKNRNRMGIAREAARAWVDALPLGYSEAGVVAFDDRAHLLQDLTTDRARLMAAIDQLAPVGGTSYDSAFLATPSGGLNLVSRGKGRRVIVFLTDGASTVNTAKIIAEAKRIGAEIHVVVVDMAAPDGLRQIAESTGGLLFDDVTSARDASDAFRVIQLQASGTDPCSLSWESRVSCELSVSIRIRIPLYGIDWSTELQLPYDLHPRLVPDRQWISFGKVLPGTSRQEILTYRAEALPVSIEAISLPPGPYTIESTTRSLPTTLEPGEEIEVVVAYRPTDEGLVTRRINISSSACFGLPISCSGGSPGLADGPTIHIVTPNGGEVFPVDGTIPIRWDGVDPADTVRLEVSDDAGETWSQVTDSATGGEYLWRAPEKPGDRYLVRGTLLTSNGNRGWIRLPSDNRVRSVAFSPTGELIVTAGDGAQLRFWDGRTGDFLFERPLPVSNGAVTTLSFSWDGELLLALNGGKTLYVVSMSDGTIREKDLQYPITCGAFLSFSKVAVLATNDGKMVEVDAVSLAVVTTWDPRSPSTFRSIAVSNGGEYYLTGGTDGFPRIYDPTGSWIMGWRPHLYGVQAVDIVGKPAGSSDTLEIDGSDYLALSAGLDGWLRVYDLPPTTSYLLHDQEEGILAATFSPDGRGVAFGGIGLDSGAVPVSIINLNSKEIRRLVGHRDNVSSIAFSRDDQYLVSGSWDSSAILWNLRDVSDAEDRSDNLWAIVRPQIELVDVDFGHLPVGSSRDSVVTAALCNRGTYRMMIDSITIPGGRFQVRSEWGRFSLEPGECVDLEFSFSPARAGADSAFCSVWSGGAEIDGVVRGIGDESSSESYYDLVDFGSVYINAEVERPVVINLQNFCKVGNVMGSMRLVGPDRSAFGIGDTAGKTFSIDTYGFSVRFSPERRGYHVAAIEFDYATCSSPNNVGKIDLIGDGDCSGAVVLDVVLPDSVSLRPGERGLIPVLRGEGGASVSGPGATTILFSWDRSTLTLTDPDREVLYGGSRATSIVRGQWDGESDTIALLDVTAGLGGVTATTIEIEKLIFTGDCDLPVELTGGLVSLDGVCTDPETRLFLETEPGFLRGVIPDPVRDAARIEYRLIEEGRYMLEVIDVTGRRALLLEDRVGLPGEYQTELRRSDLPSGTYYIRLQTATQDLLSPFVVD